MSEDKRPPQRSNVLEDLFSEIGVEPSADAYRRHLDELSAERRKQMIFAEWPPPDIDTQIAETANGFSEEWLSSEPPTHEHHCRLLIEAAKRITRLKFENASLRIELDETTGKRSPIPVAELYRLIERWRAFADEAKRTGLCKMSRHRWMDCADDLESVIKSLDNHGNE